jgi:hypothetical protein
MLYYLLEQIYVETNEKGLTQAQHEYQRGSCGKGQNPTSKMGSME